MTPFPTTPSPPAPVRLPDPSTLTDPATLELVLGPICEVTASRLETPGFSGSSHLRLSVRMVDGGLRSLVLKCTRVDSDWIAARTADPAGREGQLLGEPSLAGAWNAFACPYLAWSADGGEVALLMEDLSAHLLPDVREPIREDHEERLLGAVAALHARFWESPTLDLPWLTRPHQFLGLVHAAALEKLAAQGNVDFPHPVLERAHLGWRAAFRQLPARVAKLLRETPESLAARSADLPRTLLHGDFKVANFALIPDGRVAAFDWAMIGAGPVAIELGWHLAVNATRLAGTKEQSIARYRRLLESQLGGALGDDFWTRTVEGAVLAGGATLLWSKALALETGSDKARAEWDWWVERLAAL